MEEFTSWRRKDRPGRVHKVHKAVYRGVRDLLNERISRYSTKWTEDVA